MLLKGDDYMPINRGLKTRTAMSNAVDTSLFLKLKEYSEKSGIPVSRLLDKAIKMFLESVEG